MYMRLMSCLTTDIALEGESALLGVARYIRAFCNHLVRSFIDLPIPHH
jgi:hypothetical protein